MSNKDVDAVISHLCKKLGTTINVLIPELTRYAIAKKNTMAVIISAVVITVCILTIRRCMKANAKLDRFDDEHDFNNVAIALSFSILFGFAIWLIIALYYLSGWIIAPKAAAIEYILSMVKG